MQRGCFAPVPSSTSIPRGPGASESTRTIAGEMADGGAGQGEETAGKTRPLDFLVSMARRHRGHHLCAHWAQLFWWVTDTSKLGARTQSLPTTLKSGRSFTISLECTEQAINCSSVSQPVEDWYGAHNLDSKSLFSSWVRSNLTATPWTAANQASLSFTISQSLLRSCPWSQWSHPVFSSSGVPFSFCPQPFPASGDS